MVSFDAPRIGQVLDNLLTNAIKFSPVNGVIEIIMEPGNNYIKVTISDEGSGIRSEDLDNIFKPFKKFNTNLTENEKGTGLGLAIAKKMIELHNGRLTLTPSKKQGASFTFELPVK
jgi:signal transduction histidine kinase